ncbi:MAG: transporter substrate-binding domain-containing protein [Bacillota bacterium]|nr:transporter substrate-binding domain-containing protein [Bacillota bacterium]
MNLKKVFALAGSATLALSMVACGNSNAPQEEAGKTLTIGTSPDYEPYESLDKDGNIVGFDPDMVKLFEEYLTESEGETYHLEFVQMDFDNIITQIQGNQVDLGISGFTYREDRKVEWSKAYLGTSQVAVVPEGSSIKTLDDLKGKKLAAQTGATGEIAAKEVEGAEVVGLKNVQDIMNALAANQYDAAIVDLGVAKNYVSNAKFVMLEGSLMDEQNYIIAKEGNKEVIELMNKCIEKFIASEDYIKLCEQYGLAPLAQ